MIRAEHLAKRYGAVVAVDGLSFQVEPGETFALIGPNGAGKTTTLKMLLGLARPDRGLIRLGREALAPDDPRARHDVGYVPQRVEFPPARTVSEVLGFFAALRDLPRESVTRALERVRLVSHAGRPARELSGGYLQRLSLGQALLGDPALLVLDEPTASLDPEATWEFRSLVEQLQREGKTILLCSHLLSEVERVADRVLILVEGRCGALERLDDLRARQAGATRLEIELSEPPARAVEVVKRLGLAFELDGDRTLTVEALDGRALEVLEAMRMAGVPVHSFELQRPTLEEIFLKVVRGGPVRRREARSHRRAWPLIAALLLGVGCAGLGGPPPIAVGAPCAACGMEVQDFRFACEWKAGGGWRVYDAIECLMRDAKTASAAPPPGTGDAWLADYDTRALHAADSLWVVRGAFPSPMGGGLAGFLDRAAADSVAAMTSGRVDRLAAFMSEPGESMR